MRLLLFLSSYFYMNIQSTTAQCLTISFMFNNQRAYLVNLKQGYRTNDSPCTDRRNDFELSEDIPNVNTEYGNKLIQAVYSSRHPRDHSSNQLQKNLINSNPENSNATDHSNYISSIPDQFHYNCTRSQFATVLLFRISTFFGSIYIITNNVSYI